MKRRPLLLGVLAVLFFLLAIHCVITVHQPLPSTPPASPEAREATARQRARTTFPAHYGAPVFLRLIKENNILELWVQSPGSHWSILKRYPIAAWGGTLGPKLREGDGQSPEGFYAATKQSLNPASRYHLSFNIGYPNAYDRALGRTGSYIMIHGSDVSIGCFAMTDPIIEEIYGMVEAALSHRQTAVPIQIYPFAMTAERMQQEADSEHIHHWLHLLPGWQHTETHHEPYPSPDPQPRITSSTDSP